MKYLYKLFSVVFTSSVAHIFVAEVRRFDRHT